MARNIATTHSLPLTMMVALTGDTLTNFRDKLTTCSTVHECVRSNFRFAYSGARHKPTNGYLPFVTVTSHTNNTRLTRNCGNRLLLMRAIGLVLHKLIEALLSFGDPVNSSRLCQLRYIS